MNEATRQRDDELAILIEQSRQLGPMTSEMVENTVDACLNSSHTDLASLSEREAPMIIRPVSAYADDEPPFDPPTKEDLAARRKWADRHVAVLSATPPQPSPDGEPSPHIIPDSLKITDWRWWGTGANLDFKQDMSTRKLNITIPIAVSSPPQPATPTYINPLAALRRERKVKPGKAAKLLGISRQRLYVVEHATKPLRCMGRLLAKAATAWPVVDDETTKATPTSPHKESH